MWPSGAGEMGLVQFVDAQLTGLAAALGTRSDTPPSVVAAHVGATALDLWVSPADQRPPEPWFCVAGGSVWRLLLAGRPVPRPGAADRMPGRHTAASGQHTAFPGLVPIGRDGAGEVLVDLTAAAGAISVAGPATLVRALLAALAVGWGNGPGYQPARPAGLAATHDPGVWGQLAVTVAGFGADLALIAPGRVRAVRALAAALSAVEASLEDDDGTRHCLISVVPAGLDEVDRLTRLAGDPRVACVVAGDLPGAAWAWEIGEDGRLRTGALGFELQPHLLPPALRASLVELAGGAVTSSGHQPRSAAPDDGSVPGEGPRYADSPGSDDEPGPDDARARGKHLHRWAGLTGTGQPATPWVVAPVEVALLGPVMVRAGGPIDPEELAQATEMVVYLAVHPDGVHPNELARAIWPGGVSGGQRDRMLARLRCWLGADSIGRPHLSTDVGDRLRLGSQVRVDWQEFVALVAGAAGQREEHMLAKALRLVRGQLLAGRPAAGYDWLAVTALEADVSALVAEAAHRLSGLRLAQGDARGAVRASRSGLALAADHEVLRCDLLRATRVIGDPAYGVDPACGHRDHDRGRSGGEFPP
jgi:hypothetical protein